jgi:hypothetical protein
MRRQHGGLSDGQRELLLLGDIILAQDSVGFTSPAAEKAAWFRHRATLLQEPYVNGAGRRPVGYLRHELGLADAHLLTDFQVIRALFERNLIDTAEALAIEATQETLSGSQSPTFCDAFGTSDAIARMQVGRYSLVSCAESFAFVSRWHAWRRRAELAGKYSRLAESIRNVLADGGL